MQMPAVCLSDWQVEVMTANQTLACHSVGKETPSMLGCMEAEIGDCMHGIECCDSNGANMVASFNVSFEETCNSKFV